MPNAPSLTSTQGPLYVSYMALTKHAWFDLGLGTRVHNMASRGEYDKVICGGSNEHNDCVLLTIPDFTLCDKRDNYVLWNYLNSLMLTFMKKNVISWMLKFINPLWHWRGVGQHTSVSIQRFINTIYRRCAARIQARGALVVYLYSFICIPQQGVIMSVFAQPNPVFDHGNNSVNI
jgi:hypothetical protein